jgi:mannose-1-phosphate guanylyltransferase/mannose-6-phosphate isomerase
MAVIGEYMLDITPVILAGGSGTRLWPLSRTLFPKQFLNLGSEHSLLQQTMLRATACCAGKPVIVCNEEHRFLTAEQLRAIDKQDATILLEPAARNTAPAIAAAAWFIMAKSPDAIIAVMSADHLIDDNDAFKACLNTAIGPATENSLATFGVPPTQPETGFGYIRADVSAGTDGALPIIEFVEKPDAQTAQRYLDEGGYFWNAGIFVFKASAYLEVLQENEADMHRQTKLAVEQAKVDLDFVRLDADAFAAVRSESIDYAIMERTQNRVVIPLTTSWSDVGSWQAVFDTGAADDDGNVCIGDTITLESQNCYVHADSRLVATIGLHNIGIIETIDSVLVTDLSRSQDTRVIAQILKSKKRSEVDVHATVYRPWGSYESLAQDTRFQVKRIIVKPGAKLSLQKHFHRSEHWIVVKGTALVTVGEKEIMLTENESTYIPLGELHRMENPGSIPLILIEVQSGSYLGEDDIVRFDDVYGRG